MDSQLLEKQLMFKLPRTKMLLNAQKISRFVIGTVSNDFQTVPAASFISFQVSQ